jgi:hypothetical protein
MSVTNRLVFDPTDANTIAASSSIGAFVRSSDGTLIGNVSDALKVSLTNSSLAVTATDLDIRDLAYGTDSVTAHQGGTWDIGTVGTITNVVHVDDNSGSITVDASDLDIRDLSYASDSVTSRLQDGSGNALTSTAGALDVNIASGTLTVNDVALADTAIQNTATAVSTSAVAVVSSALAARKYLYLANESGKKMYFGKSGVTTANGFPLFPGERAELRIGPTPVVQAIGGTGASNEDLRVMELS